MSSYSDLPFLVPGSLTTYFRRPSDIPPNISIERRIPDVNTNLTIQNDRMPGICGMRRGWEITLSGFNLALLNRIESYLVAFSCYIAHRPTSTQPDQHVYWYESGISPAHFQRNLRRMSEDLGLEVSLTGQGGHYAVTYVRDALLGGQTGTGQTGTGQTGTGQTDIGQIDIEDGW